MYRQPNRRAQGDALSSRFVSYAFAVVIVLTLAVGCLNGVDVKADLPKRVGTGVDIKDASRGLKRLFIDDFFVASRNGITRTLHAATKYSHNPILPAKGEDYAEWEDPNRFAFYMSSAYDPGDRRFKIWYLAHMPGYRYRLGREVRQPHSAIAFADSPDGFNFTRRTDLGLSLSKVPGLLDESDRPITGPDIPTNIVLTKANGFFAFIDPTVAKDAPDRFKAAWMKEEGERESQTGISFSADGVHWTHYNDGEPVIGRAADTTNQLLWDPLSQQYLLVNREDLAVDAFIGDREVEVRGTRVVGRKDPSDSSRDLLAEPTAWLDENEISFLELAREGLTEQGYPREWRDRQIHATTLWPYEGVYFALLSVMEGNLDQRPDSELIESVRHEAYVVNFYIATSRDLRTWNYDWVYARQPIIERGADGAFDKDGIHSVSIVTEGGRHLLYYCGMYERFDMDKGNMSIGVAELRLDGFVSLDAGDEEGVVTTVPIKLQGDRLAINVDARAGSLMVEILDDAGNPIPGFGAAEADPLQGIDEVSAIASWRGKSSLSALRGRQVQLRFRLRRASLYEFQEVIK